MSEIENEAGEYTWSLKNILGKGAFGSVYQGKSKTSGEDVAIKVLDMKLFQKEESKQQLEQEIEVMKKLDSPYTVKLIGNQQLGDQTIIILELCAQGDLNNYLKSKGGSLKEQEAIDTISQILLGFKNLIDQGYIHRDVKPANVLLKDGIFKLSDFGLATNVDIKAQQLLKDCVGTPLFMSPQLLRGLEYTSKSDIWSIGMMYYFMLFGKAPWPSRDLNSFIINIEFVPLRFPYERPISQESKDFLIECLVVDEESRIDWENLFNHPLTKKAKGPAQDPRFSLNEKAKQIICGIQEIVQLQNLDIKKKFDDLSKENQKTLTKNSFHKLLASIDPRITSSESDYLFQEIDENDDQQLSIQEFTKFFLEFDFSDLSDKAGQLITDLKEIVKANKMNLLEVFEKYDENKGGSLDFQEFSKMIRKVANGLNQQEIEVIFRRFDTNGDSNIDLKEFVRAMTYGIELKGKREINFSGEKASKILQEFRRIVKENKLKPEEIFQKFDVDWDNALNRREFRDLIRIVDNRLSPEEVNFIFDLFDREGQDMITLDYFEKELNNNK